MEAIEAAAWYENEQPGLGQRFEEAITAALALLQEDLAPLTPVPGEAGERGLKRLILRRFPFGIVVHIDGDELTVIGIVHHARRPGYWRDRLSQ